MKIAKYSLLALLVVLYGLVVRAGRERLVNPEPSPRIKKF